MKLNTDIYINALDNEFNLDVLVSKKRKLKCNFFRAELFKGYTNGFLKLLFFILLIPIAPLINRLTFPKLGLLDKKLVFACSRKSENLFKGNNEYSHFGYLKKDIRFQLSFNEYYSYIRIIFAFIVRFRSSIWFYPEILLIPEMIKIEKFLKINKITHIVITNQYDRWAYFIPQVSKGIKVELYQHGVLSNSIQSTYKIPLVNLLVCYDEKELSLFRANIINQIHKYKIVPPSIELSPYLGPNSVLVCGTSNMAYSNIEQKILDELDNFISIKSFFRPHPLSKNKPLLGGSQLFPLSYPKVRVLIHFGSTLGVEYRNSDDNVMIIDATKYSLEEILDNIIKELV